MPLLEGVRSKIISAQVTSELHKAFKVRTAQDDLSMREALEQLLVGYVTGTYDIARSKGVCEDEGAIR